MQQVYTKYVCFIPGLGSHAFIHASAAEAKCVCKTYCCIYTLTMANSRAAAVRFAWAGVGLDKVQLKLATAYIHGLIILSYSTSLQVRQSFVKAAWLRVAAAEFCLG